jgi:hypothetical protein
MSDQIEADKAKLWAEYDVAIDRMRKLGHIVDHFQTSESLLGSDLTLPEAEAMLVEVKERIRQLRLLIEEPILHPRTYYN